MKRNIKHIYHMNNIQASCIGDAIRVAESLAQCKGLSIEICGAWVWISGTRQILEQHSPYLRAIGCKYSKDKQKWYWHNKMIRYAQSRQTQTTMQEIYNKYGQQKVTLENEN